VRPLASEAQQQLDDLVTRRRQLGDILTAERNRMTLLRGKAQASGEGDIEWLTEQIKGLDDEIEALCCVAGHPRGVPKLQRSPVAVLHLAPKSKIQLLLTVGRATKLLRGGSWSCIPRDCRSAARYNVSRVIRGFIVGFRVCCVPPRISS
jgi:hypothetical protein